MTETVTPAPAAPAKQKYELLEGIHYEKNPDWKGDKFHDPARLIRCEKGAIIESDRELDKVFVGKFKKVGAETAALNISAERRKAVTELISSGGWSEADRPFLEGMSDDGFQRFQSLSKPVGKTTSILGADVTDQFGRAYDEGLKVFRNAQGKHSVTKPGAVTKPLNPQPLAVEDVEKFLATYLKEK